MSDLVPVEQKQVMFYEDEVMAVRMADGSVYVPIRPLCELLGVTWDPQRRRINRDPVLSETVERVTVTVTDSYRTTGREMICLPLTFLNGWMFGINADRVKAEVRDRVIRYQRECYDVLAEAFQGTAVAPPAPSALVQVREMGLAIARMAEEQMALDRRVGTTERKIDIVMERVTAVEKQLAPGNSITNEQASQISQAVKAVAIALGKKSGRNEFGAVFGQLYREYGITSYKLLPSSKFDDAMKYLTEWHQEIVTGTEF